MNQPRTLTWLGATLAGTAVALGAFGAHVLADLVGAGRMATFETAVRYQFWHALALLVLAVQAHSNLVSARAAGRIGTTLVAGVAVFAGALYAIVMGDVLGLRLSWMGMVAPVGGFLMLAGWFMWARATWSQAPAERP